MRWFSVVVMVLVLSVTPIIAQDDGASVTLRIAGKCAANPHMMPFWILMEQTGGEFDDFTIEYVPVTGPPQMMALAVNNEFDVSFSFIFQGANMYMAGGAEALRVETVSLWRAFALLTSPDVKSWDDLVGARILLPQQGSGGDILTRISMENAGYDPFEDFTIEYMPPTQMAQLLVAGEAAAATVSEPQLTILASKAKQNDVILQRSAIDLMEGVYDSELWEDGLLPLGVVLVDQHVLDDADLAAAYDTFNVAYHEVAQFAQENPAEAAKMIVAQLDTTCDSQAQPKPIENALAGDFLVYDPIPAADLMADLPAFVNLLYGEEVDEQFYAQSDD